MIVKRRKFFIATVLILTLLTMLLSASAALAGHIALTGGGEPGSGAHPQGKDSFQILLPHSDLPPGAISGISKALGKVCGKGKKAQVCPKS